MESTKVKTAPITITERALHEVKVIMQDKNVPADYGLRIDHAEQTAWAAAADAGLADPLGIDTGAPLMVFCRTASAGATPVEHITSWYRGDRYQIHMTLDQNHNL